MPRIAAQTLSNKNAPKLYVRQRMLLALLDALGGSIGNLDFQKILFLYCQECVFDNLAEKTANLYEFVPYKYGAFSFTCYADRRRLVNQGLLLDEDRSWILTEAGKNAASEFNDESVRNIANQYRELRGNGLIAETYRRYPYYAIHSDIADRILQGDQEALQRITDSRPEKKSARLSTIGYEGRTLENYLNVLIQSSVTLLCDVRRNAISRKYGFSKNTLNRACNAVDIRYEHLPELGIDSRSRQGLKTQADYNALFRTYEAENLPEQGEAIEQIHGWLRSGESVALTCYERTATDCHRHCVAALFEPSTNKADQNTPLEQSEWNFTVEHL